MWLKKYLFYCFVKRLCRFNILEKNVEKLADVPFFYVFFINFFERVIVWFFLIKKNLKLKKSWKLASFFCGVGDGGGGGETGRDWWWD